MARQKPSQRVDNPLAQVTDPELRKKLEAVMKDHNRPAEEIPAAVNEFPRFCFSRSTPERHIGASVHLRNGLDENMRGGTIIKQVGRAYLVDLGDLQLIAHEPDDCWYMEQG